ncbi:histone-like nucleoid-structuring protein Lsr2 [Corynebacterium heidelbergense]|uniref:Lsr2 family protein n=1 Tax=Corynebacterium heidelbergense TaxID=2055947 RepID=A0A364V405_9CORY|nr:Lsr2 family protein [Corynebacterium heidelbergense]RAV31375.1 Lsr2 family protein [Corynebacterium heidelbergense]
MARREVTQYYDDMDNSPLNEDEVNVVDFSVNGVDYTMDLSTENQQKFQDAVGPFVNVARRKGRGGNRRSTTQRDTNSAERNRKIREWARKNGVEVSSRGRISADVVEAYRKAQG